MREWWDHAACAGSDDPTIFFPEVEKGQNSRYIWERAREYCNVCPVVSQCLEYQMAFEEVAGRRDGMFGGKTPKEREDLWQKRIRPRP